MPFWTRSSDVINRAEAIASETREHIPAFTIPTWADVSAGAVTEPVAMSVPAFARGVTLITGTIANLPLRQYRGGREVANTFMEQPEPDRAYWVTMQRTVRDLLLYGRAYWLVVDTFAPDSVGHTWPRRVRQIDAAETADDRQQPTVRYRTTEYTKSAGRGPGVTAGQVIEFYGQAHGVLEFGAEAILTAKALEEAARNYADAPIPSIALKNTGADMPRDQVIALLDAWESSRQNRSTAYLTSAVDVQQMGWSSRELQLVEARTESAIQIARVLNLEPFQVGANLPGSSLSYSNRQDQRVDLRDYTLAPLLRPIEQRLSMRDVTPTETTNQVRFDMGEFLRASLGERVDIVTKLRGLGEEVITVDEARDFLNYTPGPRSELG